MNDGVLVEALRARDPGALAALYDTYAESIHRYCWAMLGGPDGAQVALRDTLIAAEALIGSLADPAMFRLWLYALARGECLRRRVPVDLVRARTEPSAPPAAPHLTAPFMTPGADAGDADLRVVAQSAVESLSPADREVLELTARHGMSVADLAVLIGGGQRYVEAVLDSATDHLRDAVAVEILARRTVHDCERAAAIAAEFSGELTPETRGRLLKHLSRCETCSRRRVRQISAAKVFGLLPLVVLPATLRVRVLSSFIDPELVPYRRYVAERVGRLDPSGFPRSGVRREGRMAQAIAATVATVAAVATVALLFAQFAGDRRDEAADAGGRLLLTTSAAPVSPADAGATGTASAGASADDAPAREPARPPASEDVGEPVVPVMPVGQVPVNQPVSQPVGQAPVRRVPVPHPMPQPSPPRPAPRPPSAHPTVPPPSAPSEGPVPSFPPDDPTGGHTSPATPPRPPSGWPPQGGPPPAHWPHPHPRPTRWGGGFPPGHDHQHRPGKDCPETPRPRPTATPAPQPSVSQRPSAAPTPAFARSGDDAAAAGRADASPGQRDEPPADAAAQQAVQREGGEP